MTDLQNQDQLDSLFTGDAPGSATTAPDAPGAAQEARLYDFRRPHRVSKERKVVLEAMYDRMVRALELWIIGRVRGQVDLRLGAIEQMSFGEFTLALPTPCAAYVFELHDTGGQQGVINIGDEIGFYLVDRLLGGSGTSVTVMPRSFTAIERQAVRVCVDKILTLLAEAWQDRVPLSPEYTSFESLPEILQAASREEPVLATTIDVTAGEARSQIHICLPFTVLDKFFAESAQRRVESAKGSDRERAEARMVAERSLRTSRIPIAARLPSFRMSLRELSQLAPGKTLETGISLEQAAEIYIGGQLRFHGIVGFEGKRLAAELGEPAGETSTSLG